MQLKEEALFTLKFDGKPVKNELGELEQKLLDVKEAQKTLEKGSKEFADSKEDIKKLEAAIKAVREEMGVSGMTVQQLRGYYRQLTSEIDKLTPGTEAYIKKSAELQEVNTALANHRQNIRAVADEVEKQPSLWERVKVAATGYLAAFGATELMERAFSFVQDGIKKALELSDSMAGVAKSTGQSTEEVEQLSKQLDKIDTRSTKESLMGIAQIGGQLGVANNELLGFVKSVDMANVALGDEFVGGAEEVSSKLGGLQKLFKETKDLQAGDAINKIGSAINELGASGSATGPVIAEFTARIGQLGNLAPEISQTMGLGAAFQELGMTAEISASGLTNILQTASTSIPVFAQQIGVSTAKMQEFIRTDPNEFLMRLAASFKGVPVDEVNIRLQELGIKSQEAQKVMSLLKDQTELVAQKQALANKAMEQGTSLQKEFNTVNNNAAAQYEKAQKSLALIATEVGQALLPAIVKGTQGVIAFVNIIRAVPEFISENKTSLAALGIAMLTFNGSLIAATANSIAYAAAEKARIVWTNAAAVATYLLNTAMALNPAAIVVTSIALLVAGFTALYNNSTTVRGIISGLWEVMKTGVGIVGDIASKCVEWIEKGLQPLKGAFEVVKTIALAVWDVISDGIDLFNEAKQAVANFVSNGISKISTALEPVRSALASFWSLIDTGITKIKNIGSAISSFLHVDELVSKVKSAASQIGDAFNKGYGDKLAEDAPKQVATHQQTLDKKKAAETKTAGEMVDIVTSSDQKALDKKAVQAEKHRQTEAKKAKEAADKEAEEAVKSSNEGLKKIEDMRIASIKDDLQRSIATIRAKRDSEVEAMTASKASAQVKAAWEQALNEQMIRDIAKAEDDHRKKKEKDDAEADKRTLDLKIKLSGDEKTDKLQKLADVAAAQTAQVQKDVTDEKQKAVLIKQINDNLVADKAKVEAEFRAKKLQEETALQNNLYQATVADANARLMLAGSNAQAIYNAKKTLLDAEYNFNKQKLEREAAEEKAKNATLIADTDRKAQADKAIDDRLKSQLKANDVQYENDKTQLTVDKTAQRLKNQQEFFDAAKGLMQGDFTTFANLLTSKLTNEKKQLSDSQKANISKIDTVGSYAVMGIQALTTLNTAMLNKELSNIQKDKDTQLAAWKDKYTKGLINKEQYEKGVDGINAEAAAREKQARLDSFNRQKKIDIASAIINGLQAALKSLAMLGWPLGLIAAAASVATTAVQISAIKNQQPPSLARGGTIRNGGVPDGPRHGNRYGESGLSITRRDTGEEVAEMEGGEPIMVLSRKTYSNNRRLVDSLLHSSLHRNGAPIMQQGGLMFEDGGGYGYEDAMQSKYSTSSGGTTSPDTGGAVKDDTPSYDTTPASDWMNQADATATDIDQSSYQAEIDNSTKLMESIAKNTLATADGIKDLSLMIDKLQQQQVGQTDSQDLLIAQMAKMSADIKDGLAALKMAQTDSIVVLDANISTGLKGVNWFLEKGFGELETTLTQELPKLNLGLNNGLDKLRLDLLVELDKLRSESSLNFNALGLLTKTGMDALTTQTHVDSLALQNLTQLQLTELQNSLHADSLQLQLLIDLAISQLEEKLHTDLTDMSKSLNLGNSSLEKTFKAELDLLMVNLDKQLTTLRADAKQNATNLQTILETNLETLEQATHDDLTQLQNSNVTELRTVQNILSMTKSEQGVQSNYLRIISEKNLSVQTFVNVWNQIQVVADKSNLQ